MRFLKPFDGNELQKDLQAVPVFTLEDHGTATGFATIAAGCAAELATPYKLHSFGIKADQAPTFGAVNKLRESLQLDTESIARAIAETQYP